MKPHYWLSGLIVSLFCACSDNHSAYELAFFERSEVIVSELKITLGTQLKQAIQAGGPANALQVCRQIAQPITGQVSDALDRAQVSRTALRVRNLQNQADAQSTRIMKAWESELTNGDSPLKPNLKYNGDSVIVHHPIIVSEACLQCHGAPSAFSTELQTALNELYPNDQATGFELGQLRGAFRIEFSTP